MALVGVSFLTGWITTHELGSELALGRAESIARSSNDSRMRDVDLQRAVALNPANVEAVQARARYLVELEKDNFNAGRTNLMQPARIEEGVRLLGETMPVFPFRPSVLRLRGETGLMLSDLHGARGDADKARAASQDAFDNLLAAARELPRPRARREEFAASLMVSAQRVRRQDVAVGQLLNIQRNGERYMIGKAGLGANASQAWFGLGLVPHQIREFRYALDANPNEPLYIDALGAAAIQFGLRDAVLQTLELFAEKGTLNERGESLLRQLQRATPPPVSETNHGTAS